MFDADVWRFCLVAAILTITPGSDTMLVLRNSFRGGHRDGLATMFGICSGLFVHAVFSALGLSVILTNSAALFETVKLIGAAYIIWLGGKSIYESFRKKSEEFYDDNSQSVSRVRSLSEGFLTNVLNPKVAVFYLAFLPQFISAGDPVLAKSLLLAALHYVMGIVWLTAVAYFVTFARKWLLRPTIRTWIDRTAGAVLILLGIRLATAQK